MFKNQAGQVVFFQPVQKADGGDSPDLSPTGTDTIVVDVNVDAAGFTPGAGTVKYYAGGTYEYAPTQAETNGNHVAFRARESTIISLVANVYPIDPDLYKADVSNLDATVSSRMPTTHINATGGTVDRVTLTDTCTTNTDQRGTDNAALASDMANVPKRNDGVDTYKTLRDFATGNVVEQQIRERLHTTEQ